MNKYKSGMPLKFSVYDRDFSYKEHVHAKFVTVDKTGPQLTLSLYPDQVKDREKRFNS